MTAEQAIAFAGLTEEQGIAFAGLTEQQAIAYDTRGHAQADRSDLTLSRRHRRHAHTEAAIDPRHARTLELSMHGSDV